MKYTIAWSALAWVVLPPWSVESGILRFAQYDKADGVRLLDRNPFSDCF
jgi:hypothetical protein